MESVVPFDRFGLDNEKGAEAPSPAGEQPNYSSGLPQFDYTKQLEFHKQEVAEGPGRGMPEQQLNYHIGRVALYEKYQERPPSGPPPAQAPETPPDCDKSDGADCTCNLKLF